MDAHRLWITPRMVPSIAYEDVPKAVDWLIRAFGFRERREARLSGSGWTLTWMEVGDALIHLGTAGGHGLHSPKTVGGMTQSLKVYVEDVDRHFAQAKAAGATIVAEPADMFWGGRIYRAKDPEGHDWEFSQIGRELAVDDWKLPPGVHRSGSGGGLVSRNVALVTGGNSGIGFECAQRLAREGWHVLIASRNREASASAVRRIAAEGGGDRVSEAGLDLGSIDSVRRFADEVASGDVPLRALVCNAGLQMTSGPQLSPDGFELTFAVNHLGHFLLTNLLLSRLRANAPARIVVVASGVHDPKQRTGMPKADIKDLETLAATGGPRKDAFDGRLAYVNSKLCNLWFTYELMRRIEALGLPRDERPLTVNAFDPGLVPGSGLARDYPPVLRFAWNRILPGVARMLTPLVPTINPAWKAGHALARLVLDPALARVSGKYFPSYARWKEAPSSEASYDQDRARALWDESVRMCRLTPAESALV